MLKETSIILFLFCLLYLFFWIASPTNKILTQTLALLDKIGGSLSSSPIALKKITGSWV